MAGRVAHFYREAWLVIAAGGWWTQNEVLEAIPDELRARDAHTRLWYMARTGYLVKRGAAPKPGERGTRRLEYAVTPDCHVPTGVTAGRLVEAFVGRGV